MLKDTDPCPVNGTQHGKPMQSVPATFLDWIVGTSWCKRKYPEVFDYVERNRKVIDKELKEQGVLD